MLSTAGFDPFNRVKSGIHVEWRALGRGGSGEAAAGRAAVADDLVRGGCTYRRRRGWREVGMTVAVPTARAGAGVPSVLAPADAVGSRLRTSARLAVVVGLLLIPAVFANWAFTSVIGGQVAFTAHERDGMVVLRPALDALADTVAGRSVHLGALQRAAAAHPELQ